MKAKKVGMQRFRAQITVEFEAASREEAIERAKALVDRPDATVKVQQAATAWVTLATP